MRPRSYSPPQRKILNTNTAVVIFPRADGTWGGRFKPIDDDGGDAALLRGRYRTEDAAKLAAIDALAFGKHL